MPYTSSSINIANTKFDRRIKLTPQDKLDIKAIYVNGNSINSLARMYNVNKRLIQFILFPERIEHNKELRMIRGGSKQYYNKSTWAGVMREHRHYKQQLYVDGDIIKL